MPEVKEKPDILTTLAVGAGVVGVGVGVYLLLKKPPKEVPEGEWGGAGVILGKTTFECLIVPTGWAAAGVVLGEIPFSAKVVESPWKAAGVVLGEVPFSATIKAPVGLVTFSVVAAGVPWSTWGWTYWMLYYYDGITGKWVSDETWRGINDAITFASVNSGGYLGCYLADVFGNVSAFYMSEFFTPYNDAKYEYNIASGAVRRL